MKKLFFLVAGCTVANFLTAQTDSSLNEKEVSIFSNKIFLKGSLTSQNNHQKLVIIIAGSGPTDRNGNNTMGVTCNSYKLLAGELAKNNIASFRYDKRGIAKSAYKNFSEKDLTFEDYINDAITVFNYLKDSLGFKEIYFAGHSEGSLIGMVAAKKTNAKGYISIAGTGRPIDVVITEQITNQSPILGKQADSLFRILKANNKIDSLPKNYALFSIFRPGIQPYMVSWIKLNPQTEIKKLSCPVLVLQGTCDIQVTKTDAENLHTANKKSVLEMIDGMTHVLKNAEENCNDKNLKTYHDASLPLNEKFVSDIVRFINKH